MRTTPRQSGSGIAQRLINEQGFREAAKRALQQVEKTQSTDLLQRCRALNACIRQGFVTQQQQQHQQHQQQQQQQQDSSASDSDICADDSSEDSDIASDHSHHSVSAGLESEHVLPHSFAAQAPVIRRPTLVQQAAAATIQRSYRLYLSKTGRWNIVQQCSKCATQSPASKGFESSLPSKHHQQRHKAACHIQACWRRFVARRSLAVPLTPPGICNKAHAHDSLMQTSRPDSAASSSLSELECASSSGDKWDTWVLDGQASPMGLARLRTSSAARVRRKRSPVGCTPTAAVKPAALLVVQRASDRAQQVQAMERQKWMAAQSYT